MSLNLKEKKAVVADVKSIAESSNALVGAYYHGLDVDQMTALRVEARKKGVCLRVVKNSLAKRALAGSAFESASEKLVGPIVLAFSQEEPNAAARIFSDLLKDNADLDKDMVQFLWFDGEVLPGASLKQIASLPTKDEAIALLMSCIREPIAKLARTISEVQKTKAAE